MSGKPKNLSQAIDELERLTGDTFQKVKPHVEEFAAKAGDEARKVKDKVEDEVQKNPWIAVGVVGLIFFVLGFLFASRRKD